MSKIKDRKLIKSVVENGFSKKDVQAVIRKIRSSKAFKIMILVATVLERTIEHYGAVPEQYHFLIKELSLCTPVSVLLPTHDSKDFRLLENFLLQKEDIFSDYKTT